MTYERKTTISASEQISASLTVLVSAKEQYDWALEEVDRAEQLTQDYLHQLELTV